MIAGILDLDSGLDPERPDLEIVELDSRHSVNLISDTVSRYGKTTIVTTGATDQPGDADPNLSIGEGPD